MNTQRKSLTLNMKIVNIKLDSISKLQQVNGWPFAFNELLESIYKPVDSKIRRLYEIG